VRRLLASVLVLALLGGLYVQDVSGRAARYSCAGVPLSHFDKKHQLKVLKGCVIATGFVSNFHFLDPVYYFELRPDAASRYLLNADNGRYITVLFEGRSRMHGDILDDAHVEVASPWVHDTTNGPNYLVAARYIKVVPVMAPPTPVPFKIRAEVTPYKMHSNAYPTLTVYTYVGARCSARVDYDTGHSPVSLRAQTVGHSGSVHWRWHETTKYSVGVALVTCTFHGMRGQGVASFLVLG
jgi:hypothetical protein